jgi:hypothetical protein
MSEPMPEGTIHATREQWLTAAIDAVRPTFDEVNYPLPRTIHVSVGFGYNGAAENKHILAQTWATVTSEDSNPAVFISPVIATAEDAIGALMHELAHVADDCENGHRGRFVEIGTAIGLEGKPTQMLPGVATEAMIFTITAMLGTYPHSKLDTARVRVAVNPDGTPSSEPAKRVRTGPATQTNRHLACICMNAECVAKGYLIRTSSKWMAIAVPKCPVCLTEMDVS